MSNKNYTFINIEEINNKRKESLDDGNFNGCLPKSEKLNILVIKCSLMSNIVFLLSFHRESVNSYLKILIRNIVIANSLKNKITERFILVGKTFESVNFLL